MKSVLRGNYKRWTLISRIPVFVSIYFYFLSSVICATLSSNLFDAFVLSSFAPNRLFRKWVNCIAPFANKHSTTFDTAWLLQTVDCQTEIPQRTAAAFYILVIKWEATLHLVISNKILENNNRSQWLTKPQSGGRLYFACTTRYKEKWYRFFWLLSATEEIAYAMCSGWCCDTYVMCLYVSNMNDVHWMNWNIRNRRIQ